MGLLGLGPGQTLLVLSTVTVLVIAATMNPALLLAVAVPAIALLGLVLIKVDGSPLAAGLVRRARWQLATARGHTSYRSGVMVTGPARLGPAPPRSTPPHAATWNACCTTPAAWHLPGTWTARPADRSWPRNAGTATNTTPAPASPSPNTKRPANTCTTTCSPACSPPGAAPKRVTLLYRPLSAGQAARVVESEVNAAAFRSALRRTHRRDESARDATDREQALRAAREEAVGAGIGLMSLFVTVTDPNLLDRAVADIEARADAAKLRLRRMRASQAAGFATTLPCGVCPPQLARTWPH
jgi:hypothetical protein